MQIFEYPYIIITIMVFFLLIMGAIGIFFALKCVKTANGTVEKDFLSIKRLEICLINWRNQLRTDVLYT